MNKDTNPIALFDFQEHKFKHLKDEFNFLMDLITFEYLGLVIYRNFAPSQAHMSLQFKTTHNFIIAISVQLIKRINIPHFKALNYLNLGVLVLLTYLI